MRLFKLWLRRAILTLAATGGVAALTHGQALLPPGLQTNGTVYTTARSGSVQSVGGQFTTVGYRTGGASLVTTTTDLPGAGFPRVEGIPFFSGLKIFAPF